MKIGDIVKIVEGKLITGQQEMGHEVEMCFASDLMSDVLTLQVENLVLITGLANIQTIRTAEMADIKCIIFVRKKKASPEIIKLAGENNIIVIESPYSMFKSCGLLFQAGLKPVY